MILLSIQFLVGVLFSQEDSVRRINLKDDDGLRQGLWEYYLEKSEFLNNQPATVCINYVNDTMHGSYEVYNVKGDLRFRYEMVKGKRSGTGYEYYLSGRIYCIFYHFADRKAYTVQFDTKGRLSREFTEYDGKFVGIYKGYYKNGRIFVLKNYNADGDMEGELIFFYKNGRKKNLIEIENGQIIVQKRYSRSGRIKYDSEQKVE